MKEVWKDIPGFEGKYQASTHGRVRSVDRLEILAGRHPAPFQRTRKGKVLSTRVGNAGYEQVLLYDHGYAKM